MSLVLSSREQAYANKRSSVQTARSHQTLYPTATKGQLNALHVILIVLPLRAKRYQLERHRVKQFCLGNQCQTEAKQQLDQVSDGPTSGVFHRCGNGLHVGNQSII